MSCVGRQTCEECRETYESGNKKAPWDKEEPEKKHPPCSKCKPDDLLAENYQAVAVWSRCSDQWNAQNGNLKVENINIESALNTMDIKRADRLQLFDQVKLIVCTISKLVIAEYEIKAEAQKR